MIKIVDAILDCYYFLDFLLQDTPATDFHFLKKLLFGRIIKPTERLSYKTLVGIEILEYSPVFYNFQTLQNIKHLF